MFVKLVGQTSGPKSAAYGDRFVITKSIHGENFVLRNHWQLLMYSNLFVLLESRIFELITLLNPKSPLNNIKFILKIFILEVK